MMGAWKGLMRCDVDAWDYEFKYLERCRMKDWEVLSDEFLRLAKM